MSHGNASLTPTGRLRLASCVVDDGWPLRRAAERFGVSVTTAQRWSGRYRQQGQAGMGDRSSRPNRCPAQLPTRIEHRIMGCGFSAVGASADRLPVAAQSRHRGQGLHPFSPKIR
jgi:hypothetical protein